MEETIGKAVETAKLILDEQDADRVGGESSFSDCEQSAQQFNSAV